MSIRKAFSIVELICCIAILGILISLSLPLLQSSREAARRNVCQDNLVTIGMAALEYEQINGTLPPNLGFPEEFLTGLGTPGGLLDSYQQTYSLVQLLDFLGESRLADQVDPFAFENSDQVLFDVGYPTLVDWLYGAGPGFPGILSLVEGESLPVTRCPSDPGADLSEMLVAPHPTDSGSPLVFLVGPQDPAQNVRVTNYASNLGAIAVTQSPSESLIDQGFVGFHGPIRSRNSDSLDSIPDGASNVAMYGETIGWIDDSTDRNIRHGLIGGAAIGQADLYSVVNNVLGNVAESHWLQFGSAHSDIVNFVRCDGSIASVNRQIDSVEVGKFCGVADGQPFQLFLRGDVNLDGRVGLLDVGPFTDVLDNNEFQYEADVDESGQVDLQDVDPFVDLLSDQ